MFRECNSLPQDNSTVSLYLPTTDVVCLQNEVWYISCCFLNSLGEASTSNLNVSLFPYQAHLVLYEVSQELYLAVRASQLPFTIQCGYFLRMEPMRCLRNSPDNVSQLLGGGG